jgi:hypothetical protein
MNRDSVVENIGYQGNVIFFSSNTDLEAFGSDTMVMIRHEAKGLVWVSGIRGDQNFYKILLKHISHIYTTDAFTTPC